MSDTNVKIKLSADGSQVRRELKLIDQELQQLGSTKGTSKTSGKTSKNSSTDDQSQLPAIQRDSREVAKQESRDKVNERLSNEITLIRKELQKLNSHNGVGTSGGNTTTTPNPNGTVGNQNPIPTSPVPDNGNRGVFSKISDVIGKIATAAVAIKAAHAAFSYAKQGAAESRAGELAAYQTYGRTFAFTDYYDAKENAYKLGIPYAYDYNTVMNAADDNISKAGFTTLENSNSDMNAILAASRGLGINPSTLSSASANMVAMGAFESGSQDRFTKILAQSITNANMGGREDEQLQVLEEIASLLGSVSSTVSENAIGNQLNMYNALVEQNENLRGTRGASLVSDISGLARSRSTDLDILAGYGTKYTGIEGKLALREMAENDPTAYMKTVIDGARRMGLSENVILYKLSEKGISVSKAKDYLEATRHLDKQNYAETTGGEFDINRGLTNFNNSDVSISETNKQTTRNAKESVGETLVNSWLLPIEDMFNNLSPGVQGTLGLTWSAIPTLAAGYGLKRAWNLLRNGGKTSVTTPKTSWLGELFKNTPKTDVVSDWASGKGNTAKLIDIVDDGAAAGGKGLSSVDDTARAIDNISNSTKWLSKFSNFGKVLGVAGLTLDVGTSAFDAIKAYQQGDYREAYQETGGGIGSVGGGLAGAWAGGAAGSTLGSIVPVIGTAIGGILGTAIGGILGAMGGDYLGERAGESIYDATQGNTLNLTNEQKLQLQRHYNTISELYNTQGNDAAQEYTEQQVVPYLKSLGVSSSITDAYSTDIGKPDFMEDVENGMFGDVHNLSPNNYYQNVVEGAKSLGNDDATLKYKLLQNGLSPGDVTQYTKKGLDLPDTVEITSKNTDTVEITSKNTDAVEQNTEAILKLIEGWGKTLSEDVTSGGALNERQDAMSNSVTQGSQVSFWDSLFGQSHATGNDYIPYDNYLANLHKGEMVLTEAEATDYRQGKALSAGNSSKFSGSLDININLHGNLTGASPSMERQIIDVIKAQLSSNKIQEMLANGFMRMQNC